LGVILATGSLAVAENSPSTVTMDSTQLNWTGQGFPVKQECGDSADFGAGGVQNGATANNYLLWIFATDGGSVSGSPTLTLNGTVYDNATKPNAGDPGDDSDFPGAWQIVTPAPSVITSAFTTFVVADTGGGKWVLTISHGCGNSVPEAAAPDISKNAAGTYDDTFVWTIQKAVDKTYVEIQTAGGTATFNYTVTVSHGTSQDDNFVVKGTVHVSNPNSASITLGSLTEDGLSDNTSCSFDKPLPDPLVIPAGGADFDYTCDATATKPADGVYNTASMSWSAQTLGDGSHLSGSNGSVSANSSAPISFTKKEVDKCVSVNDPIDPNSPHGFCVGDTGDPTFSFTYSRTVSAPPLGQCVSYDNTATFTTNDRGKTGSSSQTVQVCRFNAPLTIGYWKTHMHLCAAKEKQATGGCSTNGPFTKTYLGTYICNGCVQVGKLGSYDATTEVKALGVFNANNCSSSMTDANAAACLAAQLLGAELNVANGANTCICGTIKDANAFLVEIGYAGPGVAVHYDLSHTRAQAIALKTKLDNYNNNKGCPA
jgi:hypothetical protein